MDSALIVLKRGELGGVLMAEADRNAVGVPKGGIGASDAVAGASVAADRVDAAAKHALQAEDRPRRAPSRGIKATADRGEALIACYPRSDISS